jgi:SAM-dependent methyltransferase
MSAWPLDHPPLPAGETGEPYVAPRTGVELGNCWFYHTIDLPGHGTIAGEWDLRAGIDDYTGRLEYRGKRVLEFGTASGFLCFALEQRGAEVVAFDLGPDTPSDMVPLANQSDLAARWQSRQAMMQRLRNSFWLAHEALRSRARVVHGSIYAVPAAIGPVDVCLFGSLLLHLRDPFLALANGARLTRQTFVVTDLLPEPWTPYLPPQPGNGRPAMGQRARRKFAFWLLRLLRWVTPYADRLPHMVLLPDAANARNLDTWWALSPAIVQQYLALLGFEDARVYAHRQPHRGRPETLFTVVAHRTQPLPQRLDGPYPWW